MKKLLALILVLAFSFALVSCRNNNTAPVDDNAGEQSEEPAKKIRVCFVASYLGDNSFSDECARGLREAEADFGIE